MKILAHGININDVRSNSGTRIDFVYANKTLVWQRAITLTLPQYNGAFNLRTFINSKNPNGVKIITVNNSRIQPSMTTGNLSGLDVTFVNNGRIRGTYPGHGALTLTSPMKLINNTWICGAGGNGKAGAAGARGANKTISSKSYSTHYKWCSCNQATSGNYWTAVIHYNGHTVISYNGKHTGWRGNIGTAWTTISGIKNTRFRRTGSRRCQVLCSHYTNFYALEREVTTYRTSYGGAGGAGGAGGKGQSFKNNRTNGSAGQNGKPPSLPGGNYGKKGQTGGNGGGWGARGGNGGGYGGFAIKGKGYLKSGSKTGSVDGSII